MDLQREPSSPPPPYELHEPPRAQNLTSNPSPSPYGLPNTRDHSELSRHHQSPIQRPREESHNPLLASPDDAEEDNNSRSSSLQLQVDDLDAASRVLSERDQDVKQALRRLSRALLFVVVVACSLYIGWWALVAYIRARTPRGGLD